MRSLGAEAAQPPIPTAPRRPRGRAARAPAFRQVKKTPSARNAGREPPSFRQKLDTEHYDLRVVFGLSGAGVKREGVITPVAAADGPEGAARSAEAADAKGVQVARSSSSLACSASRCL